MVLKIIDLKIEGQKKHLGLDETHPLFSWKLESSEKNVKQQTYKLIVTSKNETVWDTGRVESNQSINIIYKGDPLSAKTIYNVHLTIFDNKGNKAEAQTDFETGLLSGQNFQAKWITHDFSIDDPVVPVFTKEFEVDKEVVSARFYSTALGVYEVKLNGEKLGDTYFAPGWTNYQERLQYQTYKAENLLKKINKLEISVANGWYKGILGFELRNNIYGDRTAALAELHLFYSDGTKEIIRTDETWEVTDGVVKSSEFYLGETQDYTSLNSQTTPVKITNYPKERIIAQESEPVRITTEFSAVDYIETPKGEQVIDFGQNIAGFVRFKVKGEKGQKVTIKHAETLDREGNFYPDTLRAAISHDIYILNGEEQVLSPKFTFHGFRYIAIEGIEHVKKEDFIACAMHTDMKKTGSFTTSHSGINQLQSNIEWSQRDNFLDIPTDCPQRDERLGWTGDAQVFSNTAMFNFQTQNFFRKWLHDLASEQSEEFGVPHIVPNILGDQPGAAAWSDAATIVPWNLYKNYGDKRILVEQFDSMKGWVDFISSNVGENGLWQTGFQYGDWLALDKEESSDRTGATDRYFVANAYYLKSTEIVKKAAEVLGYNHQMEKYQELYDKTLQAFRKEYITSTGRLVSETQTACVLALEFNLAEEKDRLTILKTLKKNIAEHKNHLSTGFVGTPYLCKVLSENGEHELAGKLLLNEDYPSWLYSVNRGATTIWERWNSINEDGTFDESGMNSLNHYAYGSIGDWMYRKLAGINPLLPGYKEILIKPQLIKGISSVEASLDSPFGVIRSEWHWKRGNMQGLVEVPVNTTARIVLPDSNETIEVGSGVYEFDYAVDMDLKRDKFTLEGKFGYILEQPLAIELFNQYAPGMLDNPMIDLAKEMSVGETINNMPEDGQKLFEFIMQQLNAQETE